MDQVHVVRHKVLVEGRSQRAVARELGLSRMTVRQVRATRRRRVRKAEPGRGRGRSGTRSAERVQALLADVGAVDGRQAAADGHAAARVAGRRGARASA